MEQLDTGAKMKNNLPNEHGGLVGTITYLTNVVGYCQDGNVLIDLGNGWKTFGRLKPGLDPKTSFKNAQERLDQRFSDNPEVLEYYQELHDMCALENWALVHEAVVLSYQDPDGLWAELCDLLDLHFDISEVVSLCKKYQAIPNP